MPRARAGAERAASAKRRNAPVPGEEHLKKRAGSNDWQIDFTVAGHRVRESCGTANKELAAAYALKRHDETYRQVVLGEQLAVEITVNDAFVRYYQEVARETSYGERGQKYHMVVLLEALGANTLLSALTDDRISRLVQTLRAPRSKEDRGGKPERRSPATVNRYLTTLSVICNRAQDVWGAQVGPWDKSKHVLTEPKGREVFLSMEQAKALVDAACGHLRPILMLEFCTGLRASNVLGLAWEQVSLDLGRAVMKVKGGKMHSVPLPDVAVRLLAGVQPDPERRTGPVFTYGNPAVPCACERCRNKLFRGQPMKSVKRSFATACKAAGIAYVEGKRFRFHDLRHTFASWLLAETGDLMLVRDQLAHQSVQTTQRYAHLIPGRREQAVSAVAAGLLEGPKTERKAG